MRDRVSLEKEFLTTAELAELLAVSPKTIVRMVRRGALACHRIGRARRFRRVDVERFLAGCRSVAASGSGRPKL